MASDAVPADFCAVLRVVGATETPTDVDLDGTLAAIFAFIPESGWRELGLWPVPH